MERNNGIDLVRLIGAFFVIILHVEYGELSIEYVENIRLGARWAVPFFFICSGYFLNKKIETHTMFKFQSIEKNIVNLINVLLISSIVYYIPTVVTKKKILLEIENILVGSYLHLWFVGSLLFGYLFIWYIYFVRREKFLFIISILILLGALITDSYDTFFNLNLNYELFRFLLSIPFMYIGLLISRKSIPKTYIPIAIVGLVAGFFLQYYEANLFLKLFNYSRYDHQFLFGTIITTVSLFILITFVTISDNRLTIWGRKHSLFIYLYHLMIYRVIEKIFGILFPSSYGFIANFNPIIIFSITLFLSIILNKYLYTLYSILNGVVPQKESKTSKNTKRELSKI